MVVFFLGHRLKVCRCKAVANAAGVVDNESFRNRAEPFLVRNAMNAAVSTGDLYESVAAGVQPSLPKKTFAVVGAAFDEP